MEFSKNPLVARLHKFYDYSLEHLKEVAIGFAVVLLLVLLGVGYTFYRSGLQRRAHSSLVECLKYYDAKVHTADSKNEAMDDIEFFTSDTEKWTRVEEVFKKGYQKNKSSGVAAMFLAYQSDALWNLGKIAESIDVLRGAVKEMKGSNVQFSYKVKLALMLIDSGSQEKEGEGVSILKELAADQKNAVNDMALYRLGEYYWFAKNWDEAKNYWNQLDIRYGATDKKASLWAGKAKEKLDLISSK